ncbi:hypothetical protein K0M31_014465, partial [Melipona bicolor]
MSGFPANGQDRENQLPGFHDPVTRIHSIITCGHSRGPLFTRQPPLAAALPNQFNVKVLR